MPTNKKADEEKASRPVEQTKASDESKETKPPQSYERKMKEKLASRSHTARKVA